MQSSIELASKVCAHESYMHHEPVQVTCHFSNKFRCRLSFFCFVVASYVYIRRDSAGFITGISSATSIVVYFLSNEDATVSITFELMCDKSFHGEIKVSVLSL